MPNAIRRCALKLSFPNSHLALDPGATPNDATIIVAGTIS